MPNWCYTDIHFEGNKKDIEALYEFIEDCDKHPEQFKNTQYATTGFGNFWLGYPLIKAGFLNNIDNANDRIRCRGRIIYSEMDKSNNDENRYYISLTTETAWEPMLQMWNKIIKKLNLNSIKFCAKAEEIGCQIYKIYDPDSLDWFLLEEICVDGYLGSDDEDSKIDELIDTGYFTSHSFKQQVNEIFNTQFETTSQAIDFIRNFNNKFINGDSYISVNQFVRDDSIANYA